MKKRSTLERQMLVYFGLIAAASLLITVEFVWALRAATSEAGALMTASPEIGRPGHSLMKVLADLQNKALLMCVVQAVITLIVFVMFIKRITAPLQQMIEESKAIAEGDLSRTIRIRRQDEIGLLGDTINGLTSNIQEIVAFGLSMDSAVQLSLEGLRTWTDHDAACREQLDRIQERLSDFRSILESFKLLPAPLAEADEDGKP